MKWFVYVCALVMTLLAPVKRIDIAFLEPVEVVLMATEGNKVTVKTDTGEMGMGNDATDALENLVEMADGIIYLDTARYLLIPNGMEMEIETILPQFKRSIQVWRYEAEPDVAKVASYLDVHGDKWKAEGGKMGRK